MNGFYKKTVISMLAIVIAVLAFSGLTACSNSKETQESARSTYVDEHANKNASETNKDDADSEWEFVAKGTLPSTANRFVIYRDTKTDVIWVLQNSWYGDGGSSFSPRVNADGTYMTYQQYLKKGNNLDNADVLEDQS